MGNVERYWIKILEKSEKIKNSKTSTIDRQVVVRWALSNEEGVHGFYVVFPPKMRGRREGRSVTPADTAWGPWGSPENHGPPVPEEPTERDAVQSWSRTGGRSWPRGSKAVRDRDGNVGVFLTPSPQRGCPGGRSGFTLESEPGRPGSASEPRFPGVGAAESCSRVPGGAGGARRLER